MCEHIPKHFGLRGAADIERAVRQATQSVQAANASLGLLEAATRNHIDALRDAIRNGDPVKAREKKWDHVSRLAARKDKAQEQANEAVNEASTHLESLRSVINQCKLNEELLDSEKLPEGIAAYGDLRYDLEGSIHQAVEAREQTQRELRQALARHSDHLSHMLRLKQEEMEHQFTYRLREALAQEKTAFEAALSGWIQRMKAIEDVVDGKVNFRA
ncbi:unnamed protein product [Echinostoma caproni]|uniref:Autophagy-related protein 17 n=1 Tax=Echinostoma caproni TaxID=27848 RepID=A0A183AZ43_9TREM|nr:unnamed protein product [Echinostoma caproni]